jgi:hypothetical protein
METPSDRMRIPEYVKRELSEVYLLMDHIAGRPDKKLDQALVAATQGGTTVTLKDVCDVAWPPTDQDRAQTLALVLTAKDRLSHTAWPATAYSVAFTYLSVIPHGEAQPSTLRQRFIARIRRGRAGVPDTRGSRVPAPPTTTDAHDVARGSEGDQQVDEVTTTSTMVQFAKDAFPGLDAKREWLGAKLVELAWVLALLLLLTCLVSWDLAIGQRLLGDYKWLSTHPEVMQIDPAQANLPCTPAQIAAGQGSPANSAPVDASKDGKGANDASKIEPGSLCARFLAGLRVLPIMERWIGDQPVLAWFIDSGAFLSNDGRTDQKQPSSSEESATRQGYILELQRVLVTTLNYDVLPLFLGALAATAAALRGISRKTAGNELEPRDLLQVRSRILLGAFLGAVIGLLISPGASNGLFALAQVSTGNDQTGDTVALSPAALAFFAGFATGRIFTWLDNLLEKIFSLGNPKP